VTTRKGWHEVNSEGCDSTVVAANLSEFLGLAASGFGCLGLVGELKGTKWKKKEVEEVAESYTRWLAANGVAPIVGAAVWPAVQAAIKARPSFDKWLTKNKESEV